MAVKNNERAQPAKKTAPTEAEKKLAEKQQARAETEAMARLFKNKNQVSNKRNRVM
jgi:hypothetical protein